MSKRLGSILNLWPNSNLSIRAIAFLGLSISVSGLSDPPAQGFLPEPNKVEVTNVEINESFFNAPVDWNTVSERVLNETAQLLEDIRTLARERSEALGEARFREAVSRDEIRIYRLGLGRAEVNQIDGNYFFRIVHEETKLSLIFLDRDHVRVDSSHLAQIIARQHIDAGEANERGKKPGRDVVLVWHRNGMIDQTEYRPRFFPGTEQWWRDYWHATFKKPKWGDFAFGCACASLQVAAAACVSTARILIDPNAPFAVTPLVLSGAFALTIGTLGDTFRNWTYRGTQSAKIAKLSSVSLLYAYSLTFLMNGGDAHVFRITDPDGLLLNAHLFANTTLNNTGRSAWQAFSEVRTKLRLNEGKQRLFSLFGKVAEVSRATFENQLLYLIPFTLKLSGLVGLGATLTIPGTEWSVDTGTLMLIGSIPLAQYISVKYAEMKGYANAPEMRAQWNALKYLPFTFPKNIYLILKNTASDIWNDFFPMLWESTRSAGRSACSVLWSLW